MSQDSEELDPSMFTKPNWDEAPADATHYGAAHPDITWIECWYKYEPDIAKWWYIPIENGKNDKNWNEDYAPGIGTRPGLVPRPDVPSAEVRQENTGHILSPDWSLAPKGTTHFYPENKQYRACWVKAEDGQIYVKVYYGDAVDIAAVEKKGWIDVSHDTEMDVVNMIPRPGHATERPTVQRPAPCNPTANDIENW